MDLGGRETTRLICGHFEYDRALDHPLLLLFFNDLWDGKKFNTKVPWNQNEKDMLGKAEANWKSLARN